MDKIVDSLFVFRGEGVIENFLGNYSDFRAYESSKPLESAKKESKVIQKTESKYQLSYLEKREFGALEKDIEKLEKKKKSIEALFSDTSMSSEEISEKSLELEEVIHSLEKKEERWLELSLKLED